MYKFCMTNKEEMTLKTVGFFSHQSAEPKIPTIEKVVKVNFSDVAALKDYFSAEEKEAIRKHEDYMKNGPGKIELILN